MNSTPAAKDTADQIAGARESGIWSEQFSVYLDLVRFLAAAYVMLAHTKYPRFTDGWLITFGKLTNDAVMIFFVLSGLVIAHVTTQKERDFTSYALARLSRLWSVALPALLVGALADAIGTQLQASLYDGPWFAADHPLVRILISAIFSGELWFLDMLPFSNSPYWSINYEFWYYAIFAVLVFARGWQRVVLLLLTTLICGPKILLLLPVWLLGVATSRAINKAAPNLLLGLFLGIVAPLTYALYFQSGIHGHLGWKTAQWMGDSFVAEQLTWSKSFLSNYVIGFLVAAHFYGMALLLKSRSLIPAAAADLIRLCASYTFSIYLLHMPLLHFYSALTRLQPNSKLDLLLVLLLSAGTIIVIGRQTEHKKHVAKRFLLKLIPAQR